VSGGADVGTPNGTAAGRRFAVKAMISVDIRHQPHWDQSQKLSLNYTNYRTVGWGMLNTPDCIWDEPVFNLPKRHFPEKCYKTSLTTPGQESENWSEYMYITGKNYLDFCGM